jgi:membrane fusion protein (multidrug efflux system)
MDPTPIAPKKKAGALYWIGTIAVLATGVFVAHFTYTRYIKEAVARGAMEAEVVRGPRVEVATVSEGPKSRDIVLLGDARPYSTATLFAKVSGYIKTVNVDKGAQVRAGDVMAEIESAETDSQYASAQADLEYKTRLAMRARELLRTNNVSPQAAEQAEANLRMSQEQVKNLATMKSYEMIRAPFDGTVTGRFADPGALMQAALTNQASSLPVVTISDNSRLRIAAYVEQRDVTNVHIGDTAIVSDAADRERQVTAKISRTAGTLDPRTRTLYIEIDVDNKDGFLVPGSFAYVTLRIPIRSQPQIPVGALLQRGGASLVGIVGSQSEVRFRPIKIASTDGIMINVAEGVATGDRVAVNVPNEVTEGTHIRAVTRR